MKASQETMEANQEKLEATDLEANLEEIEAVAEHQEVRKEEAAVRTVGALEDRYGDRYLVVVCRRQLKKRTQGDGGSQKNLAAARILLTSLAIPARRKGPSHKGPTVEKRQQKGRKEPEFNNGIRN
jgi:hypothetical protein